MTEVDETTDKNRTPKAAQVRPMLACVRCGQIMQVVDVCDYEACPYCDRCVDALLAREKGDA